ncbi:MAG: VWA domain-containing protein [Bdellovibrionota bacterium]
MLQWFSGFQFLSPLALISALGIPLLVYAYLLKQSTKRRIVSSVVLLKNLSPKQMVRRKFSPPLRFFLEVLALSALALASAMPVMKDEQKQLALVVDTSLSMRAQELKAGSPDTRISQAKKTAQKWIDDQPSSYRFTVYTSAPKLERRSAEGVSAREARNTVDSIEATTTSDTLEAAVDDLAGSGKYERVMVVSDRTIDSSEDDAAGGNSTIASLFGQNQSTVKHYTSVGALDVGSKVANASVANFVVSKSGLSDGGLKLIATLAYSGAAPSDAKVTFSKVDGRSESVIGSGNIKLSPDKLSEMTVDAPASEGNNTVYKVALSMGKADQSTNSLTDDDVAWAASGSGGKSRILLISPTLTGTTNGLTGIENLQIETITPAEYAKLSEDQLRDYEMLIFHHSAPVLVPRRAALFILPPNENAVFPIREEVQSPRITSWAAEHPLSSYLKVPLLTLPAAQIFQVPPWAQSVIRVEAGTILVAGESEGIRLAGIGLELLPFEGARTPTTSVLMLNLLNWLSGGGQLTGSTLSGSVYHLDAGKNQQVELPNGKTEQVPDTHVLTLGAPGIYRVRDGGANEKIIPVNVFYPEESATFQQPTFHAQRIYEHEKLLDEDSKILWPMLLMFALAVLGIELLFSLRARRAEGVA